MRRKMQDEPIIPTPDGLGLGGAGGTAANEAPSNPDGETGESRDEALESVDQERGQRAQRATVHRPPYRSGTIGGDNHTVTRSDPAAGTVKVLEHNTRQAAFVHCIGNGPMATLEVQHPVTEPVSSVKIDYSNAVLTPSVVMNAIVSGSESGWLGHGASLGPKILPGDWTGTIDIPLAAKPQAGETLTIQFGLQTHAGCLPYPVLGFPGSLPVESGKASFPQVSVE